MRTYSRLGRSRPSNAEPPHKRRHLSPDSPSIQVAQRSDASESSAIQEAKHEESSSPMLSPASRDTVVSRSSDVEVYNSTPPSSPPPPRTSDVAETQQDAAKDAKRSCELASDNESTKMLRPLTCARLNVPKRPKPAPKQAQRYTQLHLDLGQKTRRQCRACGMEYIASSKEDSELHAKFHKMNAGGVVMGRTLLESDAVRSRKVWEGGSNGVILACHRSDPANLRLAAQKVLEVADTELGAVKIAEEVLWGTEDDAKGKLRFKAYLYLQGNMCVGVCLVEALDFAYRVQAAEAGGAGQRPGAVQTGPLKTTAKPYPMLMGVTRIWTSGSYRNQGIATRLLDCARQNFLYGVKIPKNEVAFSQPTAQGTALARKWYGAWSGWHVYSDE